MKHVRESLTDFYNKQYFDDLYAKHKLNEEEETESKESEEKSEESEEESEEETEEKPDKEDKGDVKDKSGLQNKEKDALDIIKKIEDDFKTFKSGAKGQVAEFKNFWEENQQAKELFSETGNIYKMHNSEYVVGVLELPIKKDADGNLEGGLGAYQEEEEIIEGKPQEEIQIEGDTAGINTPSAGTPGATMPMTEAVGEEEDMGLDLEKDPEDELMAPAEEPTPDVPEAPMEEPPTEAPMEEPPMEEPPTEAPMEEPPMEEPSIEDETGGETQTYLVVYDMGSGQRDEIFRCGSTNAVKAFRDFYQNTFKGTMLAVIQEYKEKKALEKKQAEAKEKERAAKEKQGKVQKFLSK